MKYKLNDKEYTAHQLAVKKGCSPAHVYKHMKNMTTEEFIEYEPPNTRLMLTWPEGTKLAGITMSSIEIAKVLGITREAMSSRVQRLGRDSPKLFITSIKMKALGREKRAKTLRIKEDKCKRPRWGKYKTYHQDAKEATRVRHLLNDVTTGFWEMANL